MSGTRWRGAAAVAAPAVLLLGFALAACGSGAASPASASGFRVPASGTTKVPRGYSVPAGTPPPVATAISYALRQLGKPYEWGGIGPRGYDCSGLMMMAYQAAGISIPRTTFNEVDVGTVVPSLHQLRPGDLIFTPGTDGTRADPGHVGMYIGHGLVVQAPESGAHIDIMRLNDYWAANAVAIRRIAS
ncbi:MAG TPA: C40 family peptidase [Trebonia sp.]|nr:C40 family peptidase [Trebonia sp.]